MSASGLKRPSCEGGATATPIGARANRLKRLDLDLLHTPAAQSRRQDAKKAINDGVSQGEASRTVRTNDFQRLWGVSHLDAFPTISLTFLGGDSRLAIDGPTNFRVTPTKSAEDRLCAI